MNSPIISTGAAAGVVRVWLRAEGLSVLLLSLTLYGHFGLSWWLFFGLLLTPDLGMIPYLFSPRVGAASYNLVHNYVLPLTAATLAIAFYRTGLLSYLCIWTAHIGLDRFLGYGLKYSTGFGVTHLGTLANASPHPAVHA